MINEKQWMGIAGLAGLVSGMSVYLFDGRLGLVVFIVISTAMAGWVAFRRPEGARTLLGLAVFGAVLFFSMPLAGLVLESTFTSVADVARGLLGPLAPLVAGGRFASDRKIAEIRCPLLFFHGDRDEIVDLALGRRLYELAPAGNKRFEVIRGAGHNDTTLVGGGAYFERIRSFLDQVAPHGKTGGGLR